MDKVTQGDLEPPYTAYLRDGDQAYDATIPDSIRVRGWVNGIQIFDRLVTTRSTDGKITMDWQAGDTSEPGPLLTKITAFKSGTRPSTFPPDGHLTTKVYPAAP